MKNETLKLLSDEFIYKVIRSAQPHLDDDCADWRNHFAECKYWLEIAHGIATPPAAPVQPVECQYGNGGYACCEGGPCKADEQNNAAPVQESTAERFEAMHANGDIWVTTIAAAQIARNTTQPAAQHWHDLYRAKCQELHDERARLGAQVEALEEHGQEPVGEAKHMNGVSAAHTQAIFLKSEVPVGTKLYTTPPAQEIVCSTGLCHYKPAAPVQSLPFGVGGGLVAIKTLLSRDPCVHANIAIEMLDAILKEHPAAQPAPDLQAELDATNRQVEILSDALAEARREVAALKSVQEPVAWAMYQQDRLQSFWLDKGDAYDFEFTPEHRWEPLYTTPPAAQRQWVGLTDEKIKQLADKHLDVGDGERGTHYVFGEIEFTRAIESELKELNT
jgi:hypothetical protein